MAISVSVIIVNYHTAELTRECVDSIFKHTKDVSFEIIVVDNASKDNSDIVLGADDRISYIKNDSNVGFGRANNIGASYAKGKYLFCLNSDTILTDNAIKILYDFSEAHDESNTGTVGLLLVDKEGKVNGPFSFFVTPFSILTKQNALKERVLKKTKEEGYSVVDYVCGADMFIRTSVFKKIRGFDERFFMYCEEIELQKRLAENGYRNYIVNNSGIIHFEGGSFSKGKKDQYKRYYMRRESLLRYFLIHHNKTNIIDRLSVFIVILKDLLLVKVNTSFNEAISLLLLPFKFKLVP